MAHKITGTTIDDLHRDLDTIISLFDDKDKALALIEQLKERLTQELQLH